MCSIIWWLSSASFSLKPFGAHGETRLICLNSPRGDSRSRASPRRLFAERQLETLSSAETEKSGSEVKKMLQIISDNWFSFFCWLNFLIPQQTKTQNNETNWMFSFHPVKFGVSVFLQMINFLQLDLHSDWLIGPQVSSGPLAHLRTLERRPPRR